MFHVKPQRAQLVLLGRYKMRLISILLPLTDGDFFLSVTGTNRYRKSFFRNWLFKGKWNFASDQRGA